MNIKEKLIELLSDGKFHSGEDLGRELQITRSAIWKTIKQLAEMGIAINSVRGKGYQIPNGIELLSLDKIQHELNESIQHKIQIEIKQQINSTNQYLLDGIKFHKPSGSIILAEYQTAGRGRRNKNWVSPFGANIYCSILWHFEKDPSELCGLSLAAAVAVANALEKYGILNVQLKWPNDVLWDYKKLAGILVEIVAQSYSSTQVVIGIGLNVSMPNNTHINQDWIDILNICQQKPRRNQLVAFMINEMIEMLDQYQQDGFSAFLKHWRTLDAFYNQPVTLHTPTEEFASIAKGITERGELIIIDKNNQEHRLLQGEISLRRIPKDFSENLELN